MATVNPAPRRKSGRYASVPAAAAASADGTAAPASVACRASQRCQRSRMRRSSPSPITAASAPSTARSNSGSSGRTAIAYTPSPTVAAARSVVQSEAMAQQLPNGVWVPGGPGLRAFHLQTGKIYSRFVEIVQTLAAGGFFYAPSEADLGSAEIRPYIDRYVRGRAGVAAEDRIALFKL